MLMIKRLTVDDLHLWKPLNSPSLVGEDVLLKISRTGFSLGYMPLRHAEWRDFPPAFDADPHAVLLDDRAALFAAFEDGEFIGAASLRVDPSTRWAEILDMRVESTHRRQGVGRNLLDFCERLAIKRGMHGLRIACPDTNPALCQFCEHCGFTLGGVDTKLLAYSDAERDKPLSKRASLLAFYKPIQKG